MPLVAVQDPYILVISHDDYPTDPRKDCSPFGKMVCWNSRHSLGDKHDYEDSADLFRECIRNSVIEKDIIQYVKDGNVEVLDDLVKTITVESGGFAKESSGELVTVFLGDNAMSPTIPMHSFLYIITTRTDLLKDRDIIAFYPGNRKILSLRRIFFVGEKILLVPEDRNAQIFIIDSFSEIDYVGKVTSYKVDV